MPENPKRIHLLGSGRHEEAIAAAIITPGMLLAQNSDGKLIPHGSAGGPAERNYALEDALQGRTIDDNYAADELVGFVSGSPGDVVYALLSGGEIVTLDDFLTSNGDGTLKVASGSDARIAVPLDAVDASDSNDVNERIRVRLL